MHTAAALLAAAAAGAAAAPPPVNYTDTTVTVATAVVFGRQPRDWRGGAVWEIAYVARRRGALTAGVVARQPAEFASLAALLGDDAVPPLPAPQSAPALSAWLAAVTWAPGLRSAPALVDFLSLNDWWFRGLPWFTRSTADFVRTITAQVRPAFIPHPTAIAEADTRTAPESSLDAYVYLTAFQEGHTDLGFVVGLMANYTALQPAWGPGAGAPADGRDLWAPGAAAPPRPPAEYVDVPVHFMPGGYLNGRNVRISWLGVDKYRYLDPAVLRRELGAMYAGRRPRRVLDIGTGTCNSALAFAALFPDADVVGIDLAPPFVRFCRSAAAADGAANAAFYWADARHTPFPSASFDAVHFTYVLHEMNTTDAAAVLAEAARLLRPGGALTAFECPHFDTLAERNLYTQMFTFGTQGDEDYQRYGFHGPEPFFGEFEAFDIDAAIPAAGFANATKRNCSMYECVFEAVR